jgi:hypothetical protein
MRTWDNFRPDDVQLSGSREQAFDLLILITSGKRVGACQSKALTFKHIAAQYRVLRRNIIENDCF